MKTFLCILFFCIQIAAQQSKWFWNTPLPQGNNIADVFFINSSLGWMCGEAGTILKTTDGGITFQNEIEILVNKKLNPGNYKIEFNAAGLSSGIYFYCLTTADYSAVKKMIFLK